MLSLTFFITAFMISSIAAFELFAHYARVTFCHGVRAYVPDSHQVKKTVPSFAGLLFLPLLILGTWGCLRIYYATNYTFITTLGIAMYTWFYLIGLWDDLLKFCKKGGTTILQKTLGQVGGACLFAALLCMYGARDITSLAQGLMIFSWYSFIIIGTSNAVNLTDGLDGLAGGIVAILFGLGSFIAFLQHSPLWIFGLIAALVLVAFLWINTSPAKAFMGDVGSLPLGAALAFMFLALKAEWYLALGGAVLVATTLSVALQIFWFKWKGARLFLRAPLHHHFELKGVPENRIVFRSWFITALCSLLAVFIYLNC